MKPVNIGIIGLGTVGAGTMNVLARNADEISRRAGREIKVTSAAVQDLKLKRACDVDHISLTDDPYSVVNDPEVDVIVELIGGTDTALDIVKQALRNRKHVVTANKALIAIHGNEIFSVAHETGMTVAFEAAVAGGISIIKAIREGMAGNRVESLVGIINGTCNYILTGMRDAGADFDTMLQLAQQNGYAEADPSFDIGGIDAAHKLTILASIAFGIPLQFEKVYCEGVNKIAHEDVRFADELGMRIKHLGIAKRREGGVELRVHPCLVPERRLLANVDGVMNAVLVTGDAVGATLHYGAGAGAEPTASAVVADIVDVVRTLTTDPGNRVPHLAFQADHLADLPVLDMPSTLTAYYLRLTVINRPGVLADVTRILGDLDISIEAILQKGSGEQEKILPIIILTQQTLEENINTAIARIGKLETVIGDIVRIRMESLSG